MTLTLALNLVLLTHQFTQFITNLQSIYKHTFTLSKYNRSLGPCCVPVHTSWSVNTSLKPSSKLLWLILTSSLTWCLDVELLLLQSNNITRLNPCFSPKALCFGQHTALHRIPTIPCPTTHDPVHNHLMSWIRCAESRNCYRERKINNMFQHWVGLFSPTHNKSFLTPLWKAFKCINTHIHTHTHKESMEMICR